MTREPDTYYEPDAEDFALMIAEEKEVASLRSGYHDAIRELRDYQKHTDRRLRGLSKERKRIKRHLAWAHNFDVEDDSFAVFGNDLDVIDTVPWPYDEEGGEDESLSDEAPRPVTRKDKRRAKTEQRRRKREFRIWASTRGRHLALSPVVRKTGALVPAVAA